MANSMTDVSATLRPPCWCPYEGQQHGISIQSSINLGKHFPELRANGMNSRADLNRGEVVYMSIIFPIPTFWLNLLNGYAFYCRWRDTATQPYQVGALFPSLCQATYIDIKLNWNGFLWFSFNYAIKLFSTEPISVEIVDQS